MAISILTKITGLSVQETYIPDVPKYVAPVIPKPPKNLYYSDPPVSYNHNNNTWSTGGQMFFTHDAISEYMLSSIYNIVASIPPGSSAGIWTEGTAVSTFSGYSSYGAFPINQIAVATPTVQSPPPPEPVDTRIEISLKYLEDQIKGAFDWMWNISYAGSGTPSTPSYDYITINKVYANVWFEPYQTSTHLFQKMDSYARDFLVGAEAFLEEAVRWKQAASFHYPYDTSKWKLYIPGM
jgi:hypothetical protein